MGYCRDTWVSDYTYDALYTRMRTVDGQRSSQGSPKRYQRWLVGSDGELEALSPVTTGDLGTGVVAFRGTAGGQPTTGRGHFIPFDHLDGGILLVPEGDGSLTVDSLDMASQR
jgi:hypothetical protein